MAFSLGFFSDAGLLTPFPGPLQVTQKSDGSTGPVDNLLFLGSTETSRKFQADSNPGIDDIILDIDDLAPGSGHEDTEVKLAITLLGLDSAVAGASLNLGTELLSEVANAQEVYIRVDDATGVIGTTIELFLETNLLIELDV
jgi:hypothetical protein